jgi:hypothetical protein
MASLKAARLLWMMMERWWSGPTDARMAANACSSIGEAGVRKGPGLLRYSGIRASDRKLGGRCAVRESARPAGVIPGDAITLDVINATRYRHE